LETSSSEEEAEVNLHNNSQPIVNLIMTNHPSTQSVLSATQANNEHEISNNEYTDNINTEQIDEYEVNIEDFMDQIDAESAIRTAPLYIGSPISVYDACQRLVRLTHLLNLDKKKTLVLLQELRNFFPADSRLPKTVFKLFKITNNDNLPQVRIIFISSFLMYVLFLTGVHVLCEMRSSFNKLKR
jgi:hypothetical protein